MFGWYVISDSGSSWIFTVHLVDDGLALVGALLVFVSLDSIDFFFQFGIVTFQSFVVLGEFVAFKDLSVEIAHQTDFLFS